MEKYTVVKELYSPTKITKKIELKQLALMACYTIFTSFFFSSMVYTYLRIPFYIFNFFISTYLFSYSKGNPKLYNIKALLMYLKIDTSVYIPLSNKDIMERRKKELLVYVQKENQEKQIR